MKIISTAEYSIKINTMLSSCIKGDFLTVNEIDPIDLVVPTRLDLVVKYLYAKWYVLGIDSDFAHNLYCAHISTINGFVENDGSGKVGREAFVNSFCALIDSLKLDGFTSDYPVPVSSNIILDGAHRTAAALALDIPLPVVEIEHTGICIDYKTLMHGALSAEQLDFIVYEYCKLKKNTRMVFIWPTADVEKHKDELHQVLSDNCEIVYRKDFELTPNGKKNMIRLAYSSEAWLGCIDDDYIGASNKSAWCFDRPGPVRMYVVEPRSDMVVMKETVRDIFKVGKHSIHINDTWKETIELGQCLLNKNGLEFLNYHVPRHYKWFDTLFNHYRAWIHAAGMNADNYCIEGSAAMSVFGLREARDIDFLATAGAPISTGFKEIDCHSGGVTDYNCSVDDLIFNPSHYFHYSGVKFVSLKMLQVKKEKRGEQKDLVDVAMIHAMYSGASAATSSFDFRRCLRFSFLKSKAKFYALKCRYYIYRYILR